jgi:hypothetical protein
MASLMGKAALIFYFQTSWKRNYTLRIFNKINRLDWLLLSFCTSSRLKRGWLSPKTVDNHVLPIHRGDDHALPKKTNLSDAKNKLK